MSNFSKYNFQYPNDEYNNSSSPYRFGFNGKELDNEIQGSGNSYDFGARIYDSRLGRWLSLDPRYKKYPEFSPYSAMGNNPIYIIDPGGDSLRTIGSKTEFTPYIMFEGGIAKIGYISNFKKAVNDIYSMMPSGEEGDYYRSRICVASDGSVFFDITKEEACASNDVGVECLFDMVNSEYNYAWEVASKTSLKYRKSGEIYQMNLSIDDLVFASKIPDRKIGATFVPADDSIDILRIMSPYYQGDDRNKRPSIVLHEMNKMLNEQNLGLPYQTSPRQNPTNYKGIGAHNLSIEKSKSLNINDIRRGLDNASKPAEDAY